MIKQESSNLPKTVFACVLNLLVKKNWTSQELALDQSTAN